MVSHEMRCPVTRWFGVHQKVCDSGGVVRGTRRERGVCGARRRGAWGGRAIPVVGEVCLARDAFRVMRNTASTYNRIGKPEDRVR